MFKVTTSGSSDIKAIVGAIATLAEEATFVANADGMKFRTMDPAHIALIDMELPKEAFDSYECDAELKFGVRIADLSKIIKRAKKDDNVTISVTAMNMLLINIGDKKEFEMRLLEAEATETPLPKIEYNSKATIPLSIISEALTDIGIVSEYLTVETSADAVTFSGKGDSGNATITADELENEIEGAAIVTHELSYLVSIVGSFVEKNIDCKLELSTNKPAKYIFTIAGVGVINFFMAPRVGE
jgi:proliferating cell nuclear antigen